MTKIIVDHRERASGIIKELEKKKLDIKIEQLVSADFVLETKDKDGKITTVGVEKKTQNDFINSIIDRRLITQLINLKEHFSTPLLIIEGSDNIYTLRNFHPNAIRGMLVAIAIDFQVPTIYTKNYRDTAAVIAIIAKRLDEPRKSISLLKKLKPATTKEKQQFIVESFPGVGPHIAKALLTKFKSINNIVNASIKELMSVNKMGKKKATELRGLFDTAFEGNKKE